MTIAPENLPEAAEARHAKPAPNMTQKAGLNAASYLIDFTARTAVMLLITPILLGGLGKSLFGVWQILLKVGLYLKTTDGRPTEALKWVFVREQTNPDHGPKREAIGDAIGVWLLFLPFLLSVGTLFSLLFPRTIDVLPGHLSEVQAAAAIMALNFILGGLINLPEAVLEGMNMRYRRMIARSGLTVLSGVMSVVAIKLHYGLPGLAFVQFVFSLMTAILAWTIVRKRFKWFALIRPTWAGTKRFVGLTTSYFGSSLVTKLLSTCDVVVLGIVASSALVAEYSLTSYAANVLWYTVPAAMNSVVPGLGKHLRENRHSKVFEVRDEMLTLTWLVMAASSVTILAWNRSFVNLWVGTTNYAGSWANLAIVLLTIQFVFIQTDSAVVDSTLQVKAKAKLGMIATIVSIAIAVSLAQRFGIMGLCLGLIAGRMILTLGYPRLIHSNLGSARKLDWASVLRPAIVSVVLGSGAFLVGDRVLARSWPLWMLAVSLTFAGSLFVAFQLGLPERRRSLVVGRVRDLARRKKGRVDPGPSTKEVSEL
jgi:O-antigen/teichoic acid export membrane protein